MERRTGRQAGITGPHCSFPSLACASDVTRARQPVQYIGMAMCGRQRWLSRRMNSSTVVIVLDIRLAVSDFAFPAPECTPTKSRSASARKPGRFSRTIGSRSLPELLPRAANSCSSCFALGLVVVKGLSLARPMGRDVEHGNDARRRYHHYPARQVVISPHPSTVKLP
eukprot:scaffold108310_cov29-Prasinocladus_malaysianus.AAC.1